MQAEISSFLHKNNSTVLPPLSSHQHLLINELNKISSANLSPELKEQLKHRKIDMILNEQRIGGSAIIRNK